MGKPQRIDDHSFWAGRPEAGGVFPKEAKMKQYPSNEGSGDLPNYQDSEEAVSRVQKEGISKANARKLKEGYRY